jgi:hypothetical protein
MPDYKKCSGFMVYDPGDMKSLDWCRWRDVECTVPYNIPCLVLELTERHFIKEEQWKHR